MARLSLLAPLARMFGIQPQEPPDPEEEARLRRVFRKRFHHFKLLLTANNRALEAMTDIEEKRLGHVPFGVNTIRSLCVRVSSNVHQIITNLDALTDSKYPELHQRYSHINSRVDRLVSFERQPPEGPLIMDLADVRVAHADRVGAKLATLGEASASLGLRIPNGFAITATAYRSFMLHQDLGQEIERIIQSRDLSEPDAVYRLSSELQQRILATPLPPDLERAIYQAFDRLQDHQGLATNVALRSSALGEDSQEASFAGQYSSELNITREGLINSYKQVVASKYALTAMSYRLGRGIPDHSVDMCVGCMAMLRTRAGGVLYSRNPMDIRDSNIIINAVPGLPKGVVDGRMQCDHILVSRDGMRIVEAISGFQQEKYVLDRGEGLRMQETTDEEARELCIPQSVALRLASMADGLEALFNTPQDVEWAWDEDGNIFLLQCRPLQILQDAAQRSPASPESREHGNALFCGGVAASPGVGAGPVVCVSKQADALSFPKGGVLVAVQALPAWAPLLSRASAVVTTQGSMAGHLANVARELGVPALFGVPATFDLLRDADEITVDADARCIYAGRVEALLKDARKKSGFMADSPVMKMLHQVSAHIVPLNLLNPDSIDFTPKNCETFHDITRFCHERAVRDMFHFGQDTRFPQLGSKQLHYKVPMQYWVLDLDDGFKTPVTGKYVHMEDIACLPMQMLWEGMIAIPWKGPPAMNTKGFMSVIFNATTNPDLAVSQTSSFAVRNYFMISQKFLSLQSRFGFHFCTVEALVGERKLENYISFQFKGGAADEDRRIRRARFVAWIMERYAFRTELRMDSMFARLEGMDREHMGKCLKMLGYILIHTRQLDMIMGDDQAVAWYRNSIMQDLEQEMGLTRLA